MARTDPTLTDPISDLPDKKLRVLIMARAPVGGIWRHILDVTDGLLERGHAVGIVVDSLRASDHVRATLERFKPKLELGVHTLTIPRLPGVGDVKISLQCRNIIKQTKPDIVHGHSAKGGLYARLAAWGKAPKSVYTPHGGSLHYKWSTLSGKAFLTAERGLIPLTDQFLFESAFSAAGFAQKIGATQGRERVIFNGLRANEFAGGATVLDNPDYDFAYVGEMRAIKGVDVLLEAAAGLTHDDGRPVRMLMLGDGPMLQGYKDYAQDLGLEQSVDFVGRRPAREAFAAANTTLVPSRAESLPYVVLEAIAAGRHVIATDVGGVSEIFGPTRDDLIASDDVDALREAMRQALNPQDPALRAACEARYSYVAQNFHVHTMVDQLEESYRLLAAAA